MIERRVLWTRTARRDLEAIVAYIAEDSIENALTVLDRLRERAESLTTAAERGRLVPELRSSVCINIGGSLSAHGARFPHRARQRPGARRT